MFTKNLLAPTLLALCVALSSCSTSPKTKVLDYTLVTLNGRNNSKTECVYNEYGEKTGEIIYAWESNKWKSDKKVDYTFSNDLLKEKSEYYYRDDNWVLDRTYKYEYDEKNRLIVDKIYNSEGSPTHKTEYVYGKDGKLKKEMPYNHYDGYWVKDGYTKIEYGKKTKEVRYDYGDECYFYTYSYNDKDQLNYKKEEECHEGSTTITLYTYNHNGDLEAVYFLCDYPEDGGKYEYEYHYAMKGFKVRE